ncbi:oligosaccharyltransferase complex subunit gamma [Rhodotorula toruloides]|uniref:BY PROTMAP: gi/472581659/gb/EMS19382.1/ oligosaccharyltransferase complex subunit gamma [Rhodosporidium toruloides NP11] gi/647398378/emb/CDR42237.1/ RHTO0S06e11320g1_1 [Rhodosporidium toruloides] n=1 Tax=Rhodotorula toruloides TaxID=5286 RepID=A0A0K3CCM7_RHOTO|nr:oligosaccharyltransferase complex subunit gamma [Rhodotorula toruloides]PRQ76447.1 OST3 / OST6 family-domain containing protein [Rhodotorula toruloides]
MLASPLLLALLPGLVAAATPQLDKFRALAKRNGGLLSLDAASYDELTSSPRDYSVSVVLTALGAQYKCQPCQLLQPEYTLLAKQWSSTKKSSDEEHFFAYLDFQNGPEVFQRLGLQTAPVFQLFMPTEGPRATGKLAAETVDFGRTGFKAESIASHLSAHANLPSLKFARPVDKTKVLKTVASVVVGVLAVWRMWPLFVVVFTRRYIWSAICIFTILFMTSGYMWTQIRRPLYVQAERNGQVSYIAGGYQTQLGAEVHIISAIYGILGFSAYILAYTIPKLTDPVRQRLGVYVWTGVFIVMSGVLMNIFHMKQPGYPFRIF